MTAQPVDNSPRNPQEKSGLPPSDSPRMTPKMVCVHCKWRPATGRSPYCSDKCHQAERSQRLAARRTALLDEIRHILGIEGTGATATQRDLKAILDRLKTTTATRWRQCAHCGGWFDAALSRTGSPARGIERRYCADRCSDGARYQREKVA